MVAREFESRLCHLCFLLLARRTCAHANEHGFSWAARTLEKASPLGVCVYGLWDVNFHSIVKTLYSIDIAQHTNLRAGHKTWCQAERKVLCSNIFSFSIYVVVLCHCFDLISCIKVPIPIGSATVEFEKRNDAEEALLHMNGGQVSVLVWRLVIRQELLSRTCASVQMYIIQLLCNTAR